MTAWTKKITISVTAGSVRNRLTRLVNSQERTGLTKSSVTNKKARQENPRFAATIRQAIATVSGCVLHNHRHRS